MKHQFIRITGIFCLLLLAVTATAGTWSANNFLYEPALNARGATEQGYFDTGLNRVDAHLAGYKTLGDPGYETLATALTTIASSKVTLTIPAGTVAIASNTTIGNNIALRILNGGIFSISGGVTLAINGPIEAGPYQIFSGSGTVTIWGVSTIYDAWYASPPSNPQGNIAAPVGSRFIKTSGSSPIVYNKESGTGTSGWVASSGGGSSTFTGLTDVPTSYSGQAGKAVRVNSTANGLEFYTPSSGSMTWPTSSGIPVYSGASSWLNSLTAPSGTIVGTSDAQALTNKDMSGVGNTWPTFNQNTTGTAAHGTTWGAFASISGPTAARIFTLPDLNATLLYSGGALGTPVSGTLTNCTFPTLNQNTTGTAANLSGTPALPNGTTATTQNAGDNSTKLATDAFANAAAAAIIPSQTGNSGKFLGTDGTNVSWGTPTGSGGMTWPGSAGLAVYSGASSWGTSLTAPSGTIVGTSDPQALTNKDLSGAGNTFPTFNQNTTGSAAHGTTWGQYAGIAGPTQARTYTLPDSNATLLYSGGALGAPSSGTLTNCTFPILNQNTTGTAANLSGTPTLPNGTKATTQSAGDNSTNLATTGYADNAAGARAPANVHYLTNQAESGLSAEVNLGALTTGILKHTVSVGVSTPATAGAGDVDSILPTQTGNSGKFLTTNGSTSSWGTPSGGSMTWPAAAGIAVYSGSSSWGSSLTFDTDGTLAANSDTRIASQKAVKTYADTKAPATSGTAILKGNGSGGFSAAMAGTDYIAPVSIPSTNGAYSGTPVTLTAGVAVAPGDLCFQGPNGKYYKASGTMPANWASGTYTAGQVVKPTTYTAGSGAPFFICTTGGTSGGTEPAWISTIGATTTDGGVTWTCIDYNSVYPAAMSVGTTSANATGPFILAGYLCLTSASYVPGQPFYVSASTAGALTQTRPNTSTNLLMIVGKAEGTAVSVFTPNSIIVEVK